jgi:hypothetical protein
MVGSGFMGTRTVADGVRGCVVAQPTAAAASPAAAAGIGQLLRSASALNCVTEVTRPGALYSKCRGQ